MQNTSGETLVSVQQMDAQGTCYQGYHFKREGSPDNGQAELHDTSSFASHRNADTLQIVASNWRWRMDGR